MHPFIIPLHNSCFVLVTTHQCGSGWPGPFIIMHHCRALLLHQRTKDEGTLESFITVSCNGESANYLLR